MRALRCFVLPFFFFARLLCCFFEGLDATARRAAVGSSLFGVRSGRWPQNCSFLSLRHLHRASALETHNSPARSRPKSERTFEYGFLPMNACHVDVRIRIFKPRNDGYWLCPNAISVPRPVSTQRPRQTPTAKPATRTQAMHEHPIVCKRPFITREKTSTMHVQYVRHSSSQRKHVGKIEKDGQHRPPPRIGHGSGRCPSPRLDGLPTTARGAATETCRQ